VTDVRRDRRDLRRPSLKVRRRRALVGGIGILVLIGILIAVIVGFAPRGEEEPLADTPTPSATASQAPSPTPTPTPTFDKTQF
jgi:zinc D-Ala-D-Ala carboxypeptidase